MLQEGFPVDSFKQKEENEIGKNSSSTSSQKDVLWKDWENEERGWQSWNGEMLWFQIM